MSIYFATENIEIDRIEQKVKIEVIMKVIFDFCPQGAAEAVPYHTDRQVLGTSGQKR